MLTLSVHFFNKPARQGGAIIKLHLVMVRGSEKEILPSERGIPHHAHRHGSLLNAHGAQDDKVIHCTVLQVILYLEVKLKVHGKYLTWNIWHTEIVYILTKVSHQSALHSQRQQSGLAAVRVNTKKKVSDRLVMGAVPAKARPMMERSFFNLQAEHSHGISRILTEDEVTLYIILTSTISSKRAFLLLWQNRWSLRRKPGDECWLYHNTNNHRDNFPESLDSRCEQLHSQIQLPCTALSKKKEQLSPLALSTNCQIASHAQAKVAYEPRMTLRINSDALNLLILKKPAANNRFTAIVPHLKKTTSVPHGHSRLFGVAGHRP